MSFQSPLAGPSKLTGTDDGPAFTEPVSETPQEPKMSLRVMDQNGHDISFKLKASTPMAKVMAAFAQQIGSDLSNLRFIFEGERVVGGDTPQSVSDSLALWAGWYRG